MCHTLSDTSEKTHTKPILITWTIIYLLSCPFIFWAALWSMLIFDKPSMTISIGLTIIFLFLCVPLSMLLSIWQMWSKYRKAKYRQARRLWMLPFFALALAILFMAASNALLS
jgi:hypothetical protein